MYIPLRSPWTDAEVVLRQEPECPSSRAGSSQSSKMDKLLAVQCFVINDNKE